MVAPLSAMACASLQDSGRSIVISGAGLMGTGIAAGVLASGDGRRVVLHDTSATTRSTAKQRVLHRLATLEEYQLTSVPPARAENLLHAEGEIGNVDPDSVGLWIESITEFTAEKIQLLVQLARHLPESCPIVTNTSSLDLDELRASLGETAWRFFSSHWSNPAEFFPLVEITPHDSTDPALLLAYQQFLSSHAWKPLVMTRFRAGFVLNALQFHVVDEACRILDEGMEDASSVDAAARILASDSPWSMDQATQPCLRDHPIILRLYERVCRAMQELLAAGVAGDEVIREVLRALAVRWSTIGPLKAADIGKIDLFATIHARLMEQFGILDPSPRLAQMSAAGQFGYDPSRESLRGFYEHSEQSVTADANKIRSAYAGVRRAQGLVHGSLHP